MNLNPSIESFDAWMLALPQREHIAPGRLAELFRWCQERGEAFDFHYERLLGFGGSEMGALVRGHFDTGEQGIKSPQEVVEEKLLRRFPTPGNQDMLRGRQLEPLAAKAFYQSLRDHDLKQRRDLVDQIANAYSPDLPWQLGHPDDLLEIDGRRYIPDYKVPREADDESSFDYTCQLNHYNAIAEREGIKIDGLLLVQLELPFQLANQMAWQRIQDPAGYQRSERLALEMMAQGFAGFGVRTLEIPIDRQLQQDMVEAGNYHWQDCVLQGHVPALPIPKELDEQALQDLERQSGELESWLMVNKEVESRVKACKESMSTVLSRYNLKQNQVPTPGIQATSNQPLDLKAAAADLIARGVDVADMHAPGAFQVDKLVTYIQELGGDLRRPELYGPGELSRERILERMEQLGVEPEAFIKRSTTLQLSRKKADKERVAEIRPELAAKLDSLVAKPEEPEQDMTIGEVVTMTQM